MGSGIAQKMATEGFCVVLVDLDLRDPGIGTALGLERDNRGITSYLTQDTGDDVSSLARDTVVPNLSVITAGSVPANSPELIGSQRMLEALESLKKGFDVILFDTPPLIRYTDGVVLSLMVDQIVVLARSARTPRRAMERTMDQLEQVRSRVLGCVINGADMRGAEYAFRPGSRRRHRGRARRRSPEPARS